MCSECFQLVAVHLPKTVEQEVEVTELSVVFCDVSPNPSSTAFGREVRLGSDGFCVNAENYYIFITKEVVLRQ